MNINLKKRKKKNQIKKYIIQYPGHRALNPIPGNLGQKTGYTLNVVLTHHTAQAHTLKTIGNGSKNSACVFKLLEETHKT